MISKFCKKAIQDLSAYKNSDRDELLIQHIGSRLEKSFETYEKELNDSIEYLERRNELNVVRKMNRVL